MSASLKSRLLAGGSYVLAGKAVTAASTLGINAVLSRLLTPEVYGVYVLAFSLVLVATMLSQLGLHQAVVRVVAEALGVNRPGRARGVIGRVYALAGLGIVAVVVLLVAGPGRALVVSLFDSTLLAASMGALAAWVTAMSLQVITSETFRGFQDLRSATLFGGVISGVLVLGVLSALLLADTGVELNEVLWLTAAAIGISVLLGWIVLSRRVRRLGEPEAVPSKELLAISLPLWITGLTNYVLMQSDILILGAFRSKDELAVYGNAARTVTLVSMSLMLVNLVVPPFIADLYARGERRRLERMLRIAATVAGLPAFVVLIAFLVAGGPLLGWIYGDFYRDGARVLALLSLGKLVNVWTGSCGVTMSMTGHQMQLMRVTLVTSALTVAGSLAVVGPYGSHGVASVVCAGTVLQNLVLWLATRRYTGMWTHAALPRPRDLARMFRA